MKFFMMALFMLSLASSQASIEFAESKQTEISQVQLAKNRACLDELVTHGCGDPAEDHKHFRTCLHDAFPALTEGCQKMMSNLYSRRK